MDNILGQTQISAKGLNGFIKLEAQTKSKSALSYKSFTIRQMGNMQKDIDESTVSSVDLEWSLRRK